MGIPAVRQGEAAYENPSTLSRRCEDPKDGVPNGIRTVLNNAGVPDLRPFRFASSPDRLPRPTFPRWPSGAMLP
jgi:hypothetical protein